MRTAKANAETLRRAAMPPAGMSMEAWLIEIVRRDFGNSAPIIELAERLGRSISVTVALLQRVPGLKEENGRWRVAANVPRADPAPPVPLPLVRKVDAPPPEPAIAPPAAKAIAVEDGIPVPKRRRSWGLSLQVPDLAGMKPGQSFLVPFEDKKPAVRQRQVQSLIKRYKPEGTVFTLRTLPEGVRVWRMS